MDDLLPVGDVAGGDAGDVRAIHATRPPVTTRRPHTLVLAVHCEADGIDLDVAMEAVQMVPGVIAVDEVAVLPCAFDTERVPLQVPVRGRCVDDDY